MCVSCGDLYILSVRISFSYFCVIRTLVLSFPHGLFCGNLWFHLVVRKAVESEAVSLNAMWTSLKHWYFRQNRSLEKEPTKIYIIQYKKRKVLQEDK